jgi:hypothetical protein
LVFDSIKSVLQPKANPKWVFLFFLSKVLFPIDQQLRRVQTSQYIFDYDRNNINHLSSIFPRLTNGFSRHLIDSTVILPEKVLLNPVHPRPFTRISASIPSPSGTLFPDLDSWELPQPRNSLMSAKSYKRFSSMSGTSSISTSSGPSRKVRQKFEPVLPDELLPLLGERLTVVQSFDDGWCVVGRENSTFVHTAKSLFKSQELGGNIEIGVVPAWCFLKPVKGLRAERPIRNSSLGVTVNMEGPSSRNEMISWSNF